MEVDLEEVKQYYSSEVQNAKGADSGWIITAGVIIFFMQSGFALLESGSVRFKNH